MDNLHLKFKRASIRLASSPASLTSPPPSPSYPLDPSLQPRSPTTIRRPSDDTTSDMATATYIHHLNNQSTSEFGATPSHKSTNTEKVDRSYTSDLADFLRSTGPDEPRFGGPLPSLPPEKPSGGSGFLKRFTLKRKDSSSNVTRQQQQQPPPPVPPLPSPPRRSTSGSTFSTNAINKALHQVPPPNVETKVFANG